MLKMDMLGLKTLTVIHDAVQMIARAHRRAARHGRAAVRRSRRSTSCCAQGRTAGVFQFESPLATDTLRAMKCDRFDDLVASNALLRPGPLDAGMHTVFIRRKLGQEKVTYPHPSLKEVLEPTYGVITYQEQVMRIANVLAGFSLAEADVLRKAVGKKDAELIKKELGKFVERAMALGHPKKLVGRARGADRDLRPLRLQQVALGGLLGPVLPDRVAQGPLPRRVHGGAAVVGNRQHRQGGAVHQRGARARPRGAAAGRERVGLQVHRGGDQRIRFGLGAVRNVGWGAIESIIAGARRTRRSRTLADFVERIDLRLCNKRVLESLIAAGACDSLGGHRKQLLRGAGRRAAARRSCCSRSGRPARHRSSARRPAPGARAGRAARRAALDRGRAAGPGEGSARLLHLGPSARAVPRRGRAVRHPHHRDARRVERAPGDGRGGGDRR